MVTVCLITKAGVTEHIKDAAQLNMSIFLLHQLQRERERETATRMEPTLLLLLLLTNLVQTHHLCRPTNATISAEKDGCPFCVSLTTTVCSGYCPTKESVYKSPLLSVYQHVCTYKALRYESIRLPGCGVHVEPTYTYPVALSCGCSLCKMHNTDCSRQSIMPDFCSSRRLLL